MKILITGASGFIGKHIFLRLITDGHIVRAAVRNPEYFRRHYPEADIAQVDFSCAHHTDDWTPHLKDIDVVINTVGIIQETKQQRFNDIHEKAPCALFSACEKAKVKHIIQISALGADELATSRYHLSKQAADNYLVESQLKWTILRPSIVYGPGAKSSDFFKALSALPASPILDEGDQEIQPVHIDDLVSTVCLCLGNNKVMQRKIDLVGPEPVSFKDLLSNYRQWLGLSHLKPVSIHSGLAVCFGKLNRRLGSTLITEETINMLARGNTSNIQPFIDLFGFTPRSMSDELRMHPAKTADIWYARLYFIPAFLRLSIALVWILTGVSSIGLYPEAKSLQILAQANLSGNTATLLLYGGGSIDLLLGVAMLFNRWLKLSLYTQLFLMLTYTLIISVLLPELWIHPLGSVSKNIPMFIATLCLLTMMRKG